MLRAALIASSLFVSVALAQTGGVPPTPGLPQTGVPNPVLQPFPQADAGSTGLPPPITPPLGAPDAGPIGSPVNNGNSNWSTDGGMTQLNTGSPSNNGNTGVYR